MIALICSLLCLNACTDAEHLKTPDPAVLQSINDAMELSYKQAGLDPETSHNRRHKNTAYQLALHVLDKGDWAQRIKDGDSNAANNLQKWGTALVQRVQHQRKGYPIPAIMEQLNSSTTLNTDQQYLLLGCITKLESDAHLSPEQTGLRR